jgi:hypothetical protein
MIQLIVKLGKWLETRFPTKIVVTTAEHLTLKAQIDVAVKILPDLEKQIDMINQRLSVVETSAAHTEAVKVLINEIARLKEDFITIKTGLGLSRIQDADVHAMLNGIPLTPEEPNV